MHAKNYVRSTIAAGLALVLGSACNKSHSPAPAMITPPDDDLGISLATMPLLAMNCTFATGVLTVTVKDGESAYLTLRPDDGYIVVNANMAAAGGAGSGASAGSSGSGSSGSGASLPQCATAPTNSVKIIADTSGAVAIGRSVILDYVNGIFLKSPSATVTGVKIDFTLANDMNGAKNSLKIRGSQNADSFVFGAGTAAGAALNLNPPAAPSGAGSGAAGSGAMAGTDAFPDIVFTHVAQVMIAAGTGNDRIDASGVSNAGVGTVYTGPVNLFGNDGDDLIVGGTGDDMIVGGLGNDVLKGCAGNDTYDMGAVASGNDIIQQACTGTGMTANEGQDTLDYSKRTNGVTLALSTTLAAASNPANDAGGTSGESGELARISDNIATIKMGAGNDIINVAMGSTVKHTIFGGAGDDKYTGLGAADIFDGEGGDDTCTSSVSTMDYSSAARTGGVTVSLCSMGCTPAADANDGDQSATAVTKMGTGAATSSTGGIDLSTLSSGAAFTTASVGNTIKVSNCAMGSQNDGNYKIVAYISASSVKVKVPGTISGFAADMTCDFVETLPNGMTNTGSGAALSAKTTSATVTGLPSQVRGLGRTIRLTHNAMSTGGGSAHSDDDGTYNILEVTATDTVVAIDEVTPVMGGSSFAGGAGALDWVIVGPEADNVGCAHVIGTRFDDNITGDQGANNLRGGAGNDTLNGAAGNDNLYGEAGNDNLYGGPGEDSLYGSVGTDTLVGGDGNDVLEGDSEADVFTCDGKNSSTAAMDGTSPGDSDFRVDYVATGGMADSLGMNHGCEF